jgi:hypothetical protein
MYNNRESKEKEKKGGIGKSVKGGIGGVVETETIKP